MKISIVTPTYNRENTILRAIKSVKNLKLPKNFQVEHIIVDDGSTDSTSTIIKGFPEIKYIKLKKNKGVNSARNEGIKKATGKYILFFDSDDKLTDDALIKIEKILENTKQKYFIYKFSTKNSKSNKSMTYIKKGINTINYEDMLSGKITGGEFISLVNKKVFNKIKYDENRMAFEQIFWFNACKLFEPIYISDEVIRVYYDDQKNRLSKSLLDSKVVNKRLKDYKFFLKKFEKDLIELELEEIRINYYNIIGFYEVLNHNYKEGRKWFLKSLNLNKNSKALLLYNLSFLGKMPFKVILFYYKLKA